jgi:hypothetical protein
MRFEINTKKQSSPLLLKLELGSESISVVEEIAAGRYRIPLLDQPSA